MSKPRPATHQDLAAIETCARRAYHKYVARIGREPAPMVADFATLIGKKQVHVLADENGALYGYVVFYRVGDHMMLENVAVDPARHGQGHGRVLIAFVEEQTRLAGLTAVRLYTNVHMRENVGLYEALGFVETGRRREDGFDRIYFEKRYPADMSGTNRGIESTENPNTTVSKT